MYILFAGAVILAIIISLFWLKDRLRSPLLARIAYSEPVARLAVVGMGFSMVGGLMILGEIAGF
ncbi:MAG: hypothetical protein OEY09_15720 [Gammaproteobacteria bacterium]|nr:hypothetical protein [Gammaproteobacteria bacterium]